MRSERACARLVPPLGAVRSVVDPAPLIEALVTLIADAVADRLAEQAADRTPNSTAPRLLDRRGLAELLGVSLPSIDRLTREGLPSLRVGDATPRFEAERVFAWLRERSTK